MHCERVCVLFISSGLIRVHDSFCTEAAAEAEASMRSPETYTKALPFDVCTVAKHDTYDLC